MSRLSFDTCSIFPHKVWTFICRKVSGLNKKTAAGILKYRKENGRITNREVLKVGCTSLRADRDVIVLCYMDNATLVTYSFGDFFLRVSRKVSRSLKLKNSDWNGEQSLSALGWAMQSSVIQPSRRNGGTRTMTAR